MPTDSQRDPRGAATRSDTAEIEAMADLSGPVPRVALLVSTVLFGLTGLLSLPMLLVTPMIFDAPGSEDSVYTWLLVGSLLLYPFLTLGGLVLAWRANGRGEVALALRRLQIPLLAASLVVGAVVLLELVCAGDFACR
ncbi:hypothetical protein [Nannocystis pusilla]|uniref:Uncharacterized protein n=1 Tax=Nannocystis pusilla TaxID=889268 RepID=A0ABS7U5P9_9BACT|nr:hypothetical protein [Nannocystis pusilla]MBZ5715789.1 hypothetical protein [Nannocystis pusilla]